ncbi:MAG TPA: hypothetical protein VEX60_02130 [Pyrinomonadaceae bacterium]|nr:hypothetical protein [Pyrinomonadaceae bacterium]
MGSQVAKALESLRWLPAYGWQRLARRASGVGVAHLIIALADHFEPAYMPEAPHDFAPLDVQERRLEEWCRVYPKIFDRWRDADGFPFRHTYFSPAEQYHKHLTEQLAEHCHDGWGEIEIHLHHGVRQPDTAESTRSALVEFRDTLVAHGCLSRWDGEGEARYAFVHGNWALANAVGGRYCGVDEEMQILAETGCYADMTLPCAPSAGQVPKINSLYECAPPLDRRAPHRRGRDLRVGRAPEIFPLMVQGPLGLNFAQKSAELPVPKIENAALTTAYPPTLERLRLWRRAAITVEGRPDWVFVKLHCHGMDSTDREAMLGDLIQSFLRELLEDARAGGYVPHFVTAREMVNIILAACDGRDGSPGEFRDYRLRLAGTPRGV